MRRKTAAAGSPDSLQPQCKEPMSVEIEGYSPIRRGAVQRGRNSAVVIGLVNNMPDAALESTEAQFSGLLHEAAGPHALRLRFTSLAELPRGPQARAHIARCYWPLEALLAGAPDALIVTGTEPGAPRLRDEPYWPRLAALLDWAEAHSAASVWSCLAAHAAVEHFDAIERARLPEKRCGVYSHGLLPGHPLLAGVGAPLAMPHSRWNELPLEALRAAGYEVLSFSPETGADAFVRRARSLMLFFQGHPEYEDTTLLKEYRRDVGRFLAGQQPRYPALPHGYFTAVAAALLEEFGERAQAQRTPALLGEFPFAAAAAGLGTPWRPAAIALYRNWLDFVAAARTRSAQPVSLAGL